MTRKAPVPKISPDVLKEVMKIHKNGKNIANIYIMIKAAIVIFNVRFDEIMVLPSFSFYPLNSHRGF